MARSFGIKHGKMPSNDLTGRIEPGVQVAITVGVEKVELSVDIRAFRLFYPALYSTFGATFLEDKAGACYRRQPNFPYRRFPGSQ